MASHEILGGKVNVYRRGGLADCSGVARFVQVACCGSVLKAGRRFGMPPNAVMLAHPGTTETGRRPAQHVLRRVEFRDEEGGTRGRKGCGGAAGRVPSMSWSIVVCRCDIGHLVEDLPPAGDEFAIGNAPEFLGKAVLLAKRQSQ